MKMFIIFWQTENSYTQTTTELGNGDTTFLLLNNYGKMRVFFIYRKLLIITKKERFPFLWVALTWMRCWVITPPKCSNLFQQLSPLYLTLWNIVLSCKKCLYPQGWEKWWKIPSRGFSVINLEPWLEWAFFSKAPQGPLSIAALFGLSILTCCYTQ